MVEETLIKQGPISDTEEPRDDGSSVKSFKIEFKREEDFEKMSQTRVTLIVQTVVLTFTEFT